MPLGSEINFLAKYPRTPRNPEARAREKTEEDVRIARQFGREFFDGDRRYGYGGYTWSPTRWRGVVEDMLAYYGDIYSVLDVGCAKGYMLREFRRQRPDLVVYGCDVSDYAMASAPIDVDRFLMHCPADDLEFWSDKEIDLVISINTIHNLDRTGCIKALQEIQRVGKRAYITVDAYSNEEERKRMMDWNLTALTILHVDEWRKLFEEAGYTGDYGFWMP